ncbi:MAG: 1-deoxy-D-xylulose-5-phosphate reductoisomerase [Alteromonadaceae bacterium]|nr:MAG: 1-deoxy-D-xylulose-5-phosphate reductoisomerase [Alteromonadaceae bacterium]
MKKITILGASGSIGGSTLDVLRLHPDRYSVFAVTAFQNVEKLERICLEFAPEYAVMVDHTAAANLKARLQQAGSSTSVLAGVDDLMSVSQHDDVDIVMASIVGAAGLKPTLAAVKAGKKVLLANKESLVMSGKLFMDAVKASGSELLPTDSEHNAIFQSLPDNFSSIAAAGVRKLLLTGSGGPFLSTPLEGLAKVTPEQACLHPNWSMGKKISVDSATMMNKGLEYIEACWLFNAKPSEIEVVVHPQSIVHSMVQYLDGSVIAQMGQPDMRTPIAHCLGWPERIGSGVASLDFLNMKNLTFAAPDFERFPCLGLAMEAFAAGGSYSTALNAANEVAVDKFLNGELPFNKIGVLVADIMNDWSLGEPDCIDDVITADQVARQKAESLAVSLCKAL